MGWRTGVRLRPRLLPKLDGVAVRPESAERLRPLLLRTSDRARLPARPATELPSDAAANSTKRRAATPVAMTSESGSEEERRVVGRAKLLIEPLRKHVQPITISSPVLFMPFPRFPGCSWAGPSLYRVPAVTR